jgi:hypothetical protein
MLFSAEHLLMKTGRLRQKGCENIEIKFIFLESFLLMKKLFFSLNQKINATIRQDNVQKFLDQCFFKARIDY